MKEAKYYQIKDNQVVVCELCPHYCKLSTGKTGVCKVRSNIDGKLYSTNYGLLTAVNIDPVEKKPLYHFHPGKNILSIGSNGCSLKCKCCQNWEIAQTATKNFMNFKKIELDDLINIAKNKTDNIGIAYTYNEPTVWYEYMITIAEKIKKEEMKNVMVSNGYINAKPLKELLHFIDAFNIDLKAFNDEKYFKISNAYLEPVKNCIKNIVKQNKHLEITNLIIPGINDSEDEFSKMIEWIFYETGEETVLHLSRYFPAYKMKTEATSVSVLKDLFQIAKEKLKYVYLGNIYVESAQDTFCSRCNSKIIVRRGYYINIVGLTKEGRCKFCNNQVVNC